jgi:hypothetical protein
MGAVDAETVGGADAARFLAAPLTQVVMCNVGINAIEFIPPI